MRRVPVPAGLAVLGHRIAAERRAVAADPAGGGLLPELAAPVRGGAEPDQRGPNAARQPARPPLARAALPGVAPDPARLALVRRRVAAERGAVAADRALLPPQRPLDEAVPGREAEPDRLVQPLGVAAGLALPGAARPAGRGRARRDRGGADRDGGDAQGARDPAHARLPRCRP